eukprot:scaffold1378_cov149-Skeletonema_dohrnii-CCMP3373.AAC.15
MDRQKRSFPIFTAIFVFDSFGWKMKTAPMTQEEKKKCFDYSLFVVVKQVYCTAYGPSIL